MTDEIAAGHTTAALRRWRQLVQMDSSAEFRAVTWLGMWLEKAIKALAMKQRGANPFQIAKDLKIWPAEKGTAFVQTADRLEKLEQSVDAIAIEIERISEGQRFVTKLLSEGHAVPKLITGQRTSEAV